MKKLLTIAGISFALFWSIILSGYLLGTKADDTLVAAISIALFSFIIIFALNEAAND
jgi:hypothetical protein